MFTKAENVIFINVWFAIQGCRKELKSLGAYSYLLAKSLLSIRPVDANPIHKHDIRVVGISGAEKRQTHQYFKIIGENRLQPHRYSRSVIVKPHQYFRPSYALAEEPLSR